MLRNETKKTARLEARITPAIYQLVQRAATLQGRSVSDFVVTAAQQAAEEIIHEREILELSQSDQQHFASALLKPSRLTPALKRAAAAHRRMVDEQP